MKRWLYIQCEVDKTNEMPPAFSHRFVEADCDDDAYLKGGRFFKLHPSCVARENGYKFLNDYVIQLRP